MQNSTDMAGGDFAAGSGIAVHAGFPNAAVDRSGSALSLDRLLIRHPVSTYFFRVEGHQWEDQGVFDGDLAIIDRALKPLGQNLVITWDEAGNFRLGRFRPTHTQVWGVVTTIVHRYAPVTNQ